MHLQENTLFDLDLGVKVTQNVDQYPQIHMTYAPAKFDLLHITVKMKMHLQEIHYLTLTFGSRSHKKLPSALSAPTEFEVTTSKG